VAITSTAGSAVPAMHSQYNILRTVGEVAVKTIFPLLIVVGTMANVFLFFHNVSPILTGLRMRPTHTILAHLAVANSLVLFSTGIPHVMVTFVLRKSLSSIECKLVYYVRLVARSTTMCSTCVLSTFRYLILVPRGPGTAMLRGRAPKATGPVCGTCWVFSALWSMSISVIMTSPRDINVDNYTQLRGFCSHSTSTAGITYLWSAPDAMFFVLMGWTSGSMMLLLQKHRQRVQHVHTTSQYHKSPPETRATHTVLMLVVTFVLFYMLNSIIPFYMAAYWGYSLQLIRVSSVLGSCFPTVGPFLLILRDP
uniref:Vomeronasal type-1 receptor n=1 Tax=Otolemur garnettii TaxID=30611 RepID=H0XTS3_OTOGA